jgi:hypothetical protein
LGGFFFWGLKLVNLRLTFQYVLSDIVVFIFQSQIQICCAFFKWSDSSEDVGEQKIFLFLNLEKKLEKKSLNQHPSLVWFSLVQFGLVLCT